MTYEQVSKSAAGFSGRTSFTREEKQPSRPATALGEQVVNQSKVIEYNGRISFTSEEKQPSRPARSQPI